MLSKKWIFGAAFTLLVATSSYWYIAIADVPQLDGPQTTAKDTILTYKIATYDSAAMGEKRSFGVSLPPGYNTHPHQRYPVIFLLHGGHGYPTDYYKKAAALPVIQKLYSSGKLPPSIIITPDGYDKRRSSAFYDPAYINGPHGNVDTAIGEELVKVIQSRYRTLPAPNFWAIGGLSSGGWGALNIGLHHLNNFSVMFSHSGYFNDKTGPYNSPAVYVNQLSPEDRRKFSVYLDAGSNEKQYLDESRKFHQILNRLGINNVFHEFKGGHGIVGSDSGWNYWHQHLADSLGFVGQQFNQVKRPN